MYVAALSAVEIALWDLTGKALSLPIYELLGGKFRDQIRLYADRALYQGQLPNPAEFASGGREVVDMGFTAVKFDLDQAYGHPAEVATKRTVQLDRESRGAEAHGGPGHGGARGSGTRRRRLRRHAQPLRRAQRRAGG